MENQEGANPEWANRQDVAVIGDEPMTLGFRFAGVGEYSLVGEADQARFESELERMIDTGRHSVIIVGQKHLSGISPRLGKKLMDNLLPIVVGIPGKSGGGVTSDPLRKALKRTLGIDMR